MQYDKKLAAKTGYDTLEWMKMGISFVVRALPFAECRLFFGS